jgi:hypothetical protein
MMTLHLMLTTNDCNFCVTVTFSATVFWKRIYSYLYSLSPFGLLEVCFISQLVKIAADPFQECSCFVGCSRLLSKVSGASLMSKGRTTTVVFCEGGGMSVG